MFEKPRFKTTFDIRVVAGEQLFLLDEHRQMILSGSHFALLAPLLDGSRSIGDIVREANPELTAAQVFHALDQLDRRGVLIEGNREPPAHAAFFEYCRTGSPASAKTVECVSVTAVGIATGDAVAEAVLANGLALNDDDGQFLFVVTDDYLRGELAAINVESLHTRRPWMLVKPVGTVLWIGPIFVPGETGCWSCMAQRLRANRQTEEYIAQHRRNTAPLVTSKASLPSTTELAGNLAATVFAQWLVAPDIQGKLITFDLTSRRFREHTLTRRPQCPDCGDPELYTALASQPVRLTHRKKEFRKDGGHRVQDPGATYDRLKHHVSPLLGAVSELLPAVGHRHELTPTFVAGHNFSMGVDGLVFLRQSLRGMSGGKGTSEIQAKVSGLCEAIERYNAVCCGDEPAVRGSFDDLHPAAIHPNDIMGFSDEQFAVREQWNSSQPYSRCHLIPKPLDPKREIDWTPLWSLTHERTRYLPAAFCYYGHPDFKADRWCCPDSNGTAAGNTLEEAILQGFLELVERDAVAMWWYNRIRRGLVSIESFGIPYLDAIVDYYQTINRSLWVLDITSDLGIATFACVSARTDKPIEDILLGFGSHFDPRIAILRAVTEVNQFLPAVSLSNPDGSTRYLFGDDEMARRWWVGATLSENPYLVPDPSIAPVRLNEFDDPSSDDLKTDVETCIEVARRHSLEMLVLDQTRPDIDLSVVKVVMPQLNHFWRRFGKSRLYDVPTKMGWLDQPLRSDQLNSWSIFF